MKPLLLCGLLCLPTAIPAQSLRLDAAITFNVDDLRFGGFSSLEVSADGLTFMSTSDRGTLLRGEILRENGRMVGVANLRLTDILDTKGVPLSSYHEDAEGLAVSPSGEIFMSFEANHRIMRQTSVDSLPEFVPKHPEFRTLINNSGLEALAIDDAGVLYTIPERSGELGRPFPVYRYIDGVWDRSWSIPREDDFLVSGADIFAGQLYVLDRDLAGLPGFTSRIRRCDIGASTGETLITTSPGRFDNLEGIALWQPDGGPPRIVLISDDNFLFLQKTQLVEMVLEP